MLLPSIPEGSLAPFFTGIRALAGEEWKAEGLCAWRWRKCDLSFPAAGAEDGAASQWQRRELPMVPPQRQLPLSGGGRLVPLALALLLALIPATCGQELGRVQALERELSIHLQSEAPSRSKEQPEGVLYQDYFPTTPLLPIPDDTHLDTYDITTFNHADVVASQLQVIIPRLLTLPSLLPVIGMYIQRIDDAERFLDSECGAVVD